MAPTRKILYLKAKLNLISPKCYRKVQTRPYKRSREYQELLRLFRQNICPAILLTTICNHGRLPMTRAAAMYQHKEHSRRGALPEGHQYVKKMNDLRPPDRLSSGQSRQRLDLSQNEQRGVDRGRYRAAAYRQANGLREFAERHVLRGRDPADELVDARRRPDVQSSQLIMCLRQ